MWKTAACLFGVAALMSSPVLAREKPVSLKPPTCSSCGKETYGTAIDWEGSPAAAAKKAREDKKLVFVLHVSGHFEDAAFT